jgi:hypothetical protein
MSSLAFAADVVALLLAAVNSVRPIAVSSSDKTLNMSSNASFASPFATLFVHTEP